MYLHRYDRRSLKKQGNHSERNGKGIWTKKTSNGEKETQRQICHSNLFGGMYQDQVCFVFFLLFLYSVSLLESDLKDKNRIGQKKNWSYNVVATPSCYGMLQNHDVFFFFSIYFYQLEANYFTILQWFLPYIDMNQSEVSQKDKDQYSILTHIYGIQKDGNNNPICFVFLTHQKEKELSTTN